MNKTNIELQLENAKLRTLLAELQGYLGMCVLIRDGMSVADAKHYHDKIQFTLKD